MTSHRATRLLQPILATLSSRAVVALMVVGVLASGCGGSTPREADTSSPRPAALAVVGDLPYNDAQARQFDTLLAHINADASVNFVLHLGDIKAGDEPCDDALLRARFAQLQQVATALVYTPGDNEWTDCHRAAAGRHLPTERLDFVRRLFFPVAGMTTGQRPRAVETQARTKGFEPFVENAMFEFEGVVVATVHAVGSRNGLVPWSGIDPADSPSNPRADRIAEFQAREAAALDWLDRVFDRASAVQARGIVIAMQANPGLEHPPGAPQREGFEALLQRLQQRLRGWHRPVLLVHGDFHEHFVDQPWPEAPQLTRVQGFGHPHLAWVRVAVDPASPRLFRIDARRTESAANRP